MTYGLAPGFQLFSGEEISTAITAGASGGGGGGSILTASVRVSADALQTLQSQPVTIIPAQSGIIQVITASIQANGGTASFANGDFVLFLSTDGNSEYFQLYPPFLAPGTIVNGFGGDQSSQAISNPILLTTSADYGVWGPITSSSISLNEPGTGYATGDTGQINWGSGDATYVVNTVDDSGEVLTYTITNPGVSYNTQNGLTTTIGGAQPGAGTGLQIDIVVSTSQTGYAQVDVVYNLINALA